MRTAIIITAIIITAALECACVSPQASDPDAGADAACALPASSMDVIHQTCADFCFARDPAPLGRPPCLDRCEAELPAACTSIVCEGDYQPTTDACVAICCAGQGSCSDLPCVDACRDYAYQGCESIGG